MSDSDSGTPDFIRDALKARKDDNQFRELKAVTPGGDPAFCLIDGEEKINFCSNDYLGLSRHPLVKERSEEYTRKYGTGSTASRLVSGNMSIHKELEDELARVFGWESALLFNTGFQANTSILATLADRNSLILADRKIHNSMLQGALLSRADLKRFQHNNSDHLEELLRQAREKDYNRIWVVTETVFSMDGDRNKLDELIALCRAYNAHLYSDDAHALGILGEKGLGLNYGKKGIDLSIGTFGKSFGAFGSFVCCTQPFRDFLINFCPGFIYTTALPPGVIGAVSAALELIPEMDETRNNVLRQVRELKEELNSIGIQTGEADSQIIPVIIGDERKTLNLSEWLFGRGIWASAIRPPTVEKGASRIRLTLTAQHTDSHLQQLTEAFRSWKNQL